MNEKEPAYPETLVSAFDRICDEMTYSYVCGQNMLQMKWFSEGNDS